MVEMGKRIKDRSANHRAQDKTHCVYEILLFQNPSPPTTVVKRTLSTTSNSMMMAAQTQIITPPPGKVQVRPIRLLSLHWFLLCEVWAITRPSGPTTN